MAKIKDDRSLQEIIGYLKETVSSRPVEKKPVTYNKETKTYFMNRPPSSKSIHEVKATWQDIMLDEGFTLLPNVLVDNFQKIGITHQELVLIVCLLRYSFRERKPYPATHTLSKKSGFSVRTVTRLIKSLKMKGYITVYHRYIKKSGENPRRTSNVYDLKGLKNKLVSLSL